MIQNVHLLFVFIAFEICRRLSCMDSSGGVLRWKTGGLFIECGGEACDAAVHGVVVQ